MYLGNLFFNFLKQDLFSLYILITSLSALNTGIHLQNVYYLIKFITSSSISGINLFQIVNA